MTTRRPALRYFGGKFRLADWLISLMPPHSCYVEPFCGGASVLLRKARVSAEVINDIDREVVDFFEVLRTQSAELIRAIELTPFARAEFELSAERPDHLDPVERARRLYVRCWQSMHGGLRPNKTGWRACRGIGRLTTAADEFAQVAHLWEIVDRLRGVQIDNREAIEVIQQFDAESTLFYVDPPYPKTTRSDRWAEVGYVHEMNDDDHERLLNSLEGAKGMMLVSTYPNSVYEEKLGTAGWTAHSRVARTFANKEALELVYLNPAAANRARQLCLI